jgi:sterol desaturase/sphingolipid hydroxylase (fatty acid hydroxylase superfamily)
MILWLTCLGSFLAAVTSGTLAQVLIHRRLAHHPRGKVIFKVHLYSHHSNYARVFTTPEYLPEKNLSPLYLLAGIPLVLVAWWIFPIPIFWSVTAGFGATLVGLEWLHRQYHLDRPALSGVKWFERLRSLHRVHHLHLGTNFAIVGFYWDRLLGTYSEMESSQ